MGILFSIGLFCVAVACIVNTLHILWVGKRASRFGPVDCFADKVKCETCKHWIDKVDAQNVRESQSLPNLSMWGLDSGEFQKYYCPMHQVGYDAKHTFSDGQVQYTKVLPEKVLIVDKNGKEIKGK